MDQQIAHNIENTPRTEDIHIVENVDFTAMLLSDVVLQGLLANGFKKPSPIQLKAIPMGRCGYDLIIQAKSGTGKTAVFGIIALEMIDVNKNQLQVLILAPTREIAIQIKDVLQSIGMNFKGLKIEYFIGGTSLSEDIEKLKNCHIAVGAPGRVKHLIKDRHMKTDAIRLLVLDEADKLISDSQQKDINFIYNNLCSTKQMIASSATYPGDVKNFLKKYMHSPTIIDPHQDVPLLLGIRQFVTTVKSHLNVMQQMTLKTEELIRILQNVSFTQCIVFCNYQTRAETLCNNLLRQGWPTVHISAAQNQQLRLQAVTYLKDFKCRILSTTDLTARGIDAANVDLVINYEVPNDAETYLHRMGRAGRYGSSGLCISIAAEGAEVEKLQKLLGKIKSKLSIMKFPNENVPQDIWTCDVDKFEKMHGIAENESEYICKTLKELSVTQNSVEETKSIIKVVENQTPVADDNVELLLQNLKKADENTKEACKNQLNMNPAAILEMLSKGKSIDIKQAESIDIKQAESRTEKDSQLLSNINKDDRVAGGNGGIEIKKSTRKKAKHESKNDHTPSKNRENNEQFDNKAKWFQENTVVHKNIALYNITKGVVEDESITEDNVTSTEKLLEIMQQEDNLEIKQQKIILPFTDLLNQLGLKSEENHSDINTWKEVTDQNTYEAYTFSENLESQSGLNKWEVVREPEKNQKNVECTCSDNLCSEVFDYAISKIDNHWQNVLCEYHKNNTAEEAKYREDVEETDQEYMDEDDYDLNEEYDENDEYYEESAENDAMNSELIFDEDIFVKAYDYALNTDVSNCEETKTMNCDENDAFGYAAAYKYDHLKTNKRAMRGWRKRKHQKAEAELSQCLPTANESNSDENLESHFDYCNEILTENGPYFTDEAEFETWFQQWKDNVLAVRTYVQERILAREKLSNAINS